MFLIFNLRERRHFCNSKPSKTLLIAIAISIMVATGVMTLGISNLRPVPLAQALFVMLLSAAFSLFVNDQIKFVLVSGAEVRW
jgi:H+-transporting ATPase